LNILVTGGAGFIGSHLCEKLLKEGNYVVCLDNYSTGSKNNILHLLENQNFKEIKCDILEREILKKILNEESIELIFHEAAFVGVLRTLEDPKKVFDVNIKGTEHVFEAAISTGCKKVVYASSSEVYGEPMKIPEKENDPKNVKLPYSIAKLAGEKLSDYYYRKHGLKTTSLRYFNVYGPRQDSTPYGFAVAIFIKRVLQNKPPIIFGNGSATRDFTYIEDNINATLAAGKKDSANGEVINIGTGQETKIIDLANMIITLCEKKLEPKFENERLHEIKHRVADISMMKKILGYTPKYKIEEGLKLTINWYKKNLI